MNLYELISGESFNNGELICYICRNHVSLQDYAFFNAAPFHVDCLNNIGEGWKEIADDNRLPFFMWLFDNWERKKVEFETVNG